MTAESTLLRVQRMRLWGIRRELAQLNERRVNVESALARVSAQLQELKDRSAHLDARFDRADRIEAMVWADVCARRLIRLRTSLAAERERLLADRAVVFAARQSVKRQMAQLLGGQRCLEDAQSDRASRALSGQLDRLEDEALAARSRALCPESGHPDRAFRALPQPSLAS